MKVLETTRIKHLIQNFEPHLFFDQMKRALIVSSTKRTRNELYQPPKMRE